MHRTSAPPHTCCELPWLLPMQINTLQHSVFPVPGAALEELFTIFEMAASLSCHKLVKWQGTTACNAGQEPGVGLLYMGPGFGRGTWRCAAAKPAAHRPHASHPVCFRPPAPPRLGHRNKEWGGSSTARHPRKNK